MLTPSAHRSLSLPLKSISHPHYFEDTGYTLLKSPHSIYLFFQVITGIMAPIFTPSKNLVYDRLCYTDSPFFHLHLYGGLGVTYFLTCDELSTCYWVDECLSAYNTICIFRDNLHLNENYSFFKENGWGIYVWMNVFMAVTSLLSSEICLA
jgi:hypothetical protein